MTAAFLLYTLTENDTKFECQKDECDKVILR